MLLYSCSASTSETTFWHAAQLALILCHMVHLVAPCCTIVHHAAFCSSLIATKAAAKCSVVHNLCSSFCCYHVLAGAWLYSLFPFLLQQFGGYQGYHGVEGGPEQEDGTGEVSPRHAKEPQIPRELRRLHEHSVSMSDSEAKSNFPAGPRRTRASSVPDPESEGGQAQRPLAARSADQGAKKR